ncbi:MAG: hypothetical protein GXX85_17545 [Ignavibacteria bacterium]|nr:hypothetical protein [Ignavibacteria bacterium]
MHSNLKSNLEKIFQYSRNPDELFDAFQLLIFKKVNDLELFKILLANPTISKDELLMFSEKLAKDFSDLAGDIYLWTSRVIENKTNQTECMDIALHYLKKSWLTNKFNNEPLLRACSLFNFEYDIDFPLNKNVIAFVEESVNYVKIKSKIYYSLAIIYKKAGLKEKSRECEMLAEKWASVED